MIPLSKAVLCVDCERVTASTGSCEGCGSNSLLNLANVLNHTDAALASDLRELEKIFKLQ